jgi:phage regulator Rha-like protein
MGIKKFDEFIINEAKSADCSEDILKFFEEKPHVNVDSEKWPNEKDAYSLHGLKTYFKGKFSNKDIDSALHKLLNAKGKSGLKVISFKNPLYKNDWVVLWYLDITEEKVEKLKEKYIDAFDKISQPEVERKQKSKEAAKKTVEEKARVRKEARVKSKGTEEKGVERKAGGTRRKTTSTPRKRTTTKKKS